jgi:hypothetical protein
MNALLAPRPPRLRLPIDFIVVALLMYLIDGAIVHTSVFAARPDLIAGVVAFDLTIGVTAAYWLLVVRRGHAALQTTLAVFLASIIAAALTLPAGHRAVVADIRYLAILPELVVVGILVAGVRRTKRRLASSGIELDVPERIRMLLGGANVQSRVADIVAMETSVFYFALASWRRKPFVPANTLGFAYHKKNGYAALLYTILRLALVEAIAIDFVIRVSHPTAANAFLALDLFSAVWILGLVRGVKLRPILVTRDEIHVRNGLQWRLDIPRALIERIEFGKVNAPQKRTPGYLRAAPGRPNVLIELREPLRAYGPYGFTRDVRQVGLTLDDAASFQRAILDF